MIYVSTRNPLEKVSFDEALLENLSRDGGLFVPESFPKMQMDLNTEDYAEFAFQILKQFISKSDLKIICQNAFNFQTPLTQIEDKVSELELYHGPTLAFKDYGARFLAECLKDYKKTILVATSGDTGGAVASAFWQKPNTQVIVLFPNNKISKRQEHQLTCWGENITSLGVEGSFDDCQKIAKDSFKNKGDSFKSKGEYLLSANSISLGRILPQVIYYAYASTLNYQKSKSLTRFYIPTGNAGNACAALWAKALGFPIEKLVICTNSNSTIWNYHSTGKFQPFPSHPTLANAMDVGNPSNFERILNFLNNDFSKWKETFEVFKIGDSEIQETIRRRPFDRIICPHTATAYASFAKMKSKDVEHVIVATAHPSKFESIVEPLIQQTIEIPVSLAELFNRKSHFKVVSKDWTF